jgi:uncharacterized membrane protein YfcA
MMKVTNPRRVKGMESVNKLEVTLASWYKGLPHLPENARKWLADNIWWIVLVGVILSLMGLISAIGGLLFSSAIVSVYGVAQPAYYGAAFLFAIIVLVILVINLVLSALAISPLKLHRKRGWSLLFITMLLTVLSTILALLSNQDFGTFLSGLIGIAIGGYFLFEIRDHFSTVAVKTHSRPAPATPTEAKKS